MAKNGNTNTNAKPKATGGKALPALCNVLGTLLLVGVIALCIPLTVPPFMGYQVFDIVSGSMEPEIPVGSAVYVKEAVPESIEVGDVVAYQDSGSVIVHRVTTNRDSIGELVTKGDANNTEDLRPVKYDAVIGRVEAQMPFVGTFMAIYSQAIGKVYLILIAACGVMLNMLAGRMRRDRALRAEAAAAAASAHAAHGSRAGAAGETAAVEASGASSSAAQPNAPRKRSAARVVRNVVVFVLAVVFVSSAGVIGYVTWQYNASNARYTEASDRFTNDTDGMNKPPIEVDFATLCAQNPDIVGWIYCEGTPIDYPVLHGRDNNQYLRTDYTGEYNIDGSIFVDFENRTDFSDANTIVYGHHMNSGSMFSCLEEWSQQSFYDQHPIIWLLTPTKNYKIVLFSGHHADARSDLYDIIHEPGDRMNALLVNVQADSDFKANEDVKLDPKARYVMLSTCASYYLFNDARYVLHGYLVAV